MTREQMIEALEAGCAVHHRGYTITPVTAYRVSQDGVEGWACQALTPADALDDLARFAPASGDNQ